MPPKLKILCSDKKPLKQGEIRGPPGYCFKRGLKAGFVAGLRKAEKNEVKKKKGKVLTELKTKAQAKRESEERRRMAEEDVNRARARPSLKTLYETYRQRAAVPRERDFLAGLSFRNPEYRRIGSQERKNMGTARLKEWVLRSGEYVK